MSGSALTRPVSDIATELRRDCETDGIGGRRGGGAGGGGTSRRRATRWRTGRAGAGRGSRGWRVARVRTTHLGNQGSGRRGAGRRPRRGIRVQASAPAPAPAPAPAQAPRRDSARARVAGLRRPAGRGAKPLTRGARSDVEETLSANLRSRSCSIGGDPVGRSVASRVLPRRFCARRAAAIAGALARVGLDARSASATGSRLDRREAR